MRVPPVARCTFDYLARCASAGGSEILHRVVDEWTEEMQSPRVSPAGRSPLQADWELALASCSIWVMTRSSQARKAVSISASVPHS